MAARILMVAVLMALYGCGQSSETADSFESVEQPSSPEASASGTVMPTGHDVELKTAVVEQADPGGQHPPYVYVECGYDGGCEGSTSASASATASASASASDTGSDQWSEDILDALHKPATLERLATVLVGPAGAVVLTILTELMEWIRS